MLANTIAQETQVQTTSNRLDVNISVLVRCLEQIRSERQLNALALALSGIESSSGNNAPPTESVTQNQTVSSSDSQASLTTNIMSESQTSSHTTDPPHSQTLSQPTDLPHSQTSSQPTGLPHSQTPSQTTDLPDFPSHSGLRQSTSSIPAVMSREDELYLRMQRMEENMRRMNYVVRALQYTVSHCLGAMRVMCVEVQALSVHVRNGSFTWRIPEISRRYQDVVNSSVTYVCSPPFYTSPKGYRVCVRAYLNGDGIGKGTHLSASFVIMRSEHDSDLPWPFNKVVKLSLVNQKQPEDSNSITHTFNPDLTSSSFQRPRQDMNVASGCPMFAPLSVLRDERYVSDDAIYLREGHN